MSEPLAWLVKTFDGDGWPCQFIMVGYRNNAVWSCLHFPNGIRRKAGGSVTPLGIIGPEEKVEHNVHK